MSDMYLIRKGGGYYRPNAEGYTTSVHDAGRYTLAEAISHSHPNGPDGPRDGIDYVPAPPAVGLMQRCPECHTKFQQVHNVDAMLATPQPAEARGMVEAAAAAVKREIRDTFPHMDSVRIAEAALSATLSPQAGESRADEHGVGAELAQAAYALDPAVFDGLDPSTALRVKSAWREAVDTWFASPPAPADNAGLVEACGIYIAARFSRRHEAHALAKELMASGHKITSRWVKPEADHVLPTGISAQAADAERQRFAMEDCDDVRAANWTISLMEEPRSNTRGGRHIEFGMAIALGHRLTIIGPRETVFHHLPNVEHYETVETFLSALRANGAEREEEK